VEQCGIQIITHCEFIVTFIWKNFTNTVIDSELPILSAQRIFLKSDAAKTLPSISYEITKSDRQWIAHQK
jgi:hypothetical protein